MGRNRNPKTRDVRKSGEITLQKAQQMIDWAESRKKHRISWMMGMPESMDLISDYIDHIFPPFTPTPWWYAATWYEKHALQRELRQAWGYVRLLRAIIKETK